MDSVDAERAVRYLRERETADLLDIMPLARTLPAEAIAGAMGLTGPAAAKAADLTGRRCWRRGSVDLRSGSGARQRGTGHILQRTARLAWCTRRDDCRPRGPHDPRRGRLAAGAGPAHRVRNAAEPPAAASCAGEPRMTGRQAFAALHRSGGPFLQPNAWHVAAQQDRPPPGPDLRYDSVLAALRRPGARVP